MTDNIPTDEELYHTHERAKEMRQHYYDLAKENDKKMNELLEKCGLPKSKTFHDLVVSDSSLEDYK